MVNATVVMMEIINEIMLYMISTRVSWWFPYWTSANVLINRPLVYVHKSETNKTKSSVGKYLLDNNSKFMLWNKKHTLKKEERRERP